MTMDKASASASSYSEGKWKLTLDLHAEGAGPFELDVQGNNKLVISDVVVGEVWFCSGQSNMELRLIQTAAAPAEIAQSANPMLRQFLVPLATSLAPTDKLAGKWVLAGPATSGGFTAVGYYFGKKLQKELNVPIGLIDSSFGGTPVEGWTSTEAFESLAADDPLRLAAEKSQKDAQAFQDYFTQYNVWVSQNHRSDHPVTDHLDDFTNPAGPDTAWKPIALPGLFSSVGLPDAGAIWVRRKVTIPPFLANHKLDLHLGDLRDSVTVYWNGQKVGQADAKGLLQFVSISDKLVTAGEATLALRIFSPSGGGGILPGKDTIRVADIPLAGEWQGRAEYEFPALEAAAQASCPVRPSLAMRAQDTASSLYNGMIYPLLPYGLTGTIWFQGESNVSRAYQYRTAFPLLIQDWRKKWGRGNFPFYFCQLSNYGPPDSKPGDNALPELREAQNMTLALPNTGQAILIDIGEAANIHAGDKRDVGDRLALIALAKTYDKPVVYSGPVYDSMVVEGNKIRIHLKNTDGGLVAKAIPVTYQPNFAKPETLPLVRNTPDSQMEGFAVSGADHVWKWATANIEGNDIVVSAADVSVPVAVRYDWTRSPIGNLYNGAGLPAGPFRTDDFPLTTINDHY